MKRLRLLFVAAIWLLVTRLALDYGALLLPLGVAHQLTLEAFLTLAQAATTAFGLGLAALVLRAPREELGLRGASARPIGLGALSAPLVFALSLAVGIAVALPTLLAELHRGGAAVSQQNVGELGRALEHAPLWLTLVWAAVAAPVAEELLFRGAIWSAFQRLFAPAAIGEAKAAPPSSLPPELIDDGALVKAARRIGAALRSGGFATLASAAVFGAMHLGMAGGSGIVRVVSATCLGLACGTARHLAGSVAAPLALHVVYNVISIGHSRGWFVTPSFPAMYGMPTLLLVAAGVSAVLLVIAMIAPRLGRRRAAPVPDEIG
jgi:membrane protease YdiL (CAAX protease family)